MVKKRRRDHRDDNLQVGLSVSRAGAGAVEDCLAELEQLSGLDQVLPPPLPSPAITKPQQASVKRSKVSQETTTSALANGVKSDSDILWDPTLAKSRLSNVAIDRIQIWNASLNRWITKGTYTAGLLPSFETEVARHFQVEKLSKYLLDTCKGLKMPAFERWLLDAKLEERQRNEAYAATDAIIPNAQPGYKACHRLAEEMVESKLTSQTDAKKIIKELCRRTATAISDVASQFRRYAHKIPLHKGDKIELEVHDKIYSLLYASKRYKKPFCIRLAKSHYEELQQMFLYTHNHAQVATTSKLGSAPLRGKTLHAFHYIIMTVLLRYSSLSGGQLLLEMRGGGMQGAVHGQVFRVLRECFSDGPLLECFASPLNAYLPSFGSAFPEIDWHFGSVGDFTESSVTSGCCEANPPFTPGVMNAMVQRIEYCLGEADRLKKSLTFAIIVPTVPDDMVNGACAKRFAAAPFRRMTSSASCRSHIVLAAREHGYIAGAQHLKTTRYKYSIFETSVILMQSEASRAKALPEGFEERIREAFQSRHLTEVGGLKKGQNEKREEAGDKAAENASESSIDDGDESDVDDDSVNGLQ